MKAVVSYKVDANKKLILQP